MPTSVEILEEIGQRIPEALTLSVGQVVDDSVKAFHLALAKDAAEGLRDLCRAARHRLSEGELVSYTAMAELDRGEYFLIDDDETLAELSTFRSLSDNLGSIPQIAPAELDLSIKLYAVTVGDGTDRILFVRRTNPRLRQKTGRFLAIGNERLTQLDEQIFAFDPDFDFILGPDWAIVLNQRSFEVLFRSIGLVQQHIDVWIKGVSDHLPMSMTSVESLKDVAVNDSRTWRRLRDIERRGHLADVTLEQVAEYAEIVGLDRNQVVVNGELVFDPAERFGFLHLLNEDLYTGPLTGEKFESQRKAAM